MNLYVGNLPYTTSSDDLRDLFAEYGDVTKAVALTVKLAVLKALAL